MTKKLLYTAALLLILGPFAFIVYDLKAQKELNKKE